MSFERVVCGIDMHAASIEAARQAIRLAPPGASILLVSVLEPPIVMDPAAIPGEWEVHGYDPEVFAALEDSARANLESAAETLGGERRETRVEARLQTGPAARTLAELAEQEGSSLIALGVKEEHRLLGILGASVSHWLIHHAHCSVLVARAGATPQAFPSSIVVGTDGSEAAERAVALASELAARLGAELRALVAEPQKHGHRGAAARQLEGIALSEVVEDERSPVDALAGVAADLIVVGSRGRNGLRRLGSVSERVAQKAGCSVLVAR